MTKIKFYSLHGYNDSNIVKVKCEGYTDGKYQYYKLDSVWFAIVPRYGLSIAKGKTRKEAQAKAHEKNEALEKFLETNGEKLRERFLNAPTQEEIEHNARVAEEQHTETETEEETAEETNEPTTEPEEKKENEPMTTTYNITHNAKFDSYEVTFESKPATVKPTTPDDEPTKPAKGEPKEEPAAEETASVQPAEQAQEAESVVEAVAESAKTHTPNARYQVIMSQCFSADHEEDIITAGVCYNNLSEARCTAIGVIGEYDASAIFDGRTGKIIEITPGFPYWRIDVNGHPCAEEPATIYKIDENGHDIIVKCTGDDCYTVEYREDGKRLGNIEENCSAEYIDFKYGILVNPEQNTQNQPEPTPAETATESAGEIPEEAPETAGFHPIINNLPMKSKWDVWNVQPDKYLSSCVVPLVRCDENYHVLDTVYLKVDTPEEVKTLMSAAAVGNRRRWPKYSKQYRRETVQRAADIIEKYYI